MGCGTPWIWRGTPRIAHLLRKTTSHATSPPLRFGSVTGCRPIKSKIPTISCVSKLPPKWREFYFLHVPSSKPCNLVSKAHSVTGCRVILHKPCNLAGRACSVTGCRPIKRQSPTASYVSELPTKQREFVFCMACSFRENLALLS